MLQTAMAYATLANGGTLFVPQVVERVEASDGKTIVAYQPKVAHEVKVPPDALDIWRRGMWKVANEKGGTAFDHGHVDIVPVMGKTGTAEFAALSLSGASLRRTIGTAPARSSSQRGGLSICCAMTPSVTSTTAAGTCSRTSAG